VHLEEEGLWSPTPGYVYEYLPTVTKTLPLRFQDVSISAVSDGCRASRVRTEPAVSGVIDFGSHWWATNRIALTKLIAQGLAVKRIAALVVLFVALTEFSIERARFDLWIMTAALVALSWNVLGRVRRSRVDSQKHDHTSSMTKSEQSQME
jgi:hypothetical protein